MRCSAPSRCSPQPSLPGLPPRQTWALGSTLSPLSAFCQTRFVSLFLWVRPTYCFPRLFAFLFDARVLRPYQPSPPGHPPPANLVLWGLLHRPSAHTAKRGSYGLQYLRFFSRGCDACVVCRLPAFCVLFSCVCARSMLSVRSRCCMCRRRVWPPAASHLIDIHNTRCM